DRLSDFRVLILNERREPVWSQTVAKPPDPREELEVSGAKPITFNAAYADYSQPSFDAANVLDNKDASNRGWAIGGQAGKPHHLTLIPASERNVPPGSTIKVTIEQLAEHENHTLGRFRVTTTDDERAVELARTPGSILAILK